MNNPQLLNRVIENLYLATAWISAFTCLIRTDYNFTFALFGYYYWITKKSYTERTKILIGVCAVLIVFDILWLLTAGSSWSKVFPGTPIWNSTHGLRVFAITLSIVNIVTKALTALALLLIDRSIKGGNRDLEITPLGASDYLEQNKPYVDQRPIGPR